MCSFLEIRTGVVPNEDGDRQEPWPGKEEGMTLGEAGHGARVVQLLRIIGNERLDQEERVSAHKQLRREMGPDAIEDLARILADDQDPQVQRAAASVLGSTRHDDAVRHLVRALTQCEEPELKKAFVWGLAQTEHVDAIQPLNMAFEEADDPEVKRAAAWGLVHIRHEAVIPLLSKVFMECSDFDIRVNAARALGEAGYANAGPLLISALASKEENELVKEAAAEALGTTGATEAIPSLGKALLAETNPEELRRAAARALGAIGHVTALPYLAKAAQRDKSVRVRSHAADALAELRLADEIPCLGRYLLYDGDPVVRATAASALGATAQSDAIEYLGKALVEDCHQLVQPAIVSALLGMRHTVATSHIGRILTDGKYDPEVRRDAAKALGEIGTAEAVSHLGSALAGDGKDAKSEVRIATARALRSVQQPKARTYLRQSLVSDKVRAVRETAADCIRHTEGLDWQDEASRIIQMLKDSQQERGQIDAQAIVSALSPPKEALTKDQYLLTDYLIGQAIGQDNRMTGDLAKLIIQSVGESPLLAGERVNEYQEAHEIPEAKLRGLRIEIGGETALDPIMETLKTNLDKYFQEPIHDLNEHTRAMWQRTMVYAQIGFIARITMSILVFLVGMALVAISSWQVLSGNLQLDLEQLLGPGVSFVSGLGTMLLIVYTGPLKEIRRSVNDLGIGSAAFIAYVHRVLEISHTFSFYYLKEQITFEEMGKSSELIKGAMNDTIMMLHEDGAAPPKGTDKGEAATGKEPSAEATEKEELATEVLAKAKLASEAAAKIKSAAEAAGVAANEKATSARATEGEEPASQPPTKKENT
jgi:HEAT repeat protein